MLYCSLCIVFKFQASESPTVSNMDNVSWEPSMDPWFLWTIKESYVNFLYTLTVSTVWDIITQV